MPRKKEEAQAPNLLQAAQEIAERRGIPFDGVLHALENALKKGFVNKVLGGEVEDMTPAEVECSIDPETGKVFLAQIKDVVATEDDIEDDYLQIDAETANAGLARAKYKAGDKYAVEADLTDLTTAIQKGFLGYLHQELAEAERTELYKIYKDRIGEMIVGTVEKADDRTVTVKLGRVTVEMGKRDLIRNEFFKAGDVIKVYIQEVRAADENSLDPKKRRGPQIELTRSSEGFLKRLFEEEIHEIYDGTVVIKGIARQSGVRAKIAVASNNPDVDPTGACIGQGGSRIQKIVEQLGNGPTREKLDIVEWSEYAPKFILESVHPVNAIGVIVDEEEKTAKIIVSPEVFSRQATRYRNNLPLASRLTGYRLEYLPLDRLDGAEFISADEAEAEANRLKAERAAEEFRKKTLEEALRLEEEKRKLAEEEAKHLAEEAAKAEAALKEAAKAERLARVEPLPEMPAVTPKAAATEADFPAEAANPAAAALAALAAKEMLAAEPAETPEEEPVAAPLPEEAPAEKEEAKEEKRDVKTTTTLESLEKDLELSKKSGAAKPTYSKSAKRPRKISEDEVKRESAPKIPTIQGLGVTYTEDELAQIEEEERNASLSADALDDDIDYDDYDEYYDE